MHDVDRTTEQKRDLISLFPSGSTLTTTAC